MSSLKYMLDISAAHKEAFAAGKQAAAEQIFADLESALRLSKTTHVGQQFYSPALETSIEVLKRKYGVK